MSVEHQDAAPDRGSSRTERGAPAGSGEGWGWDLVQRDWSLRQREPAPQARVLAGLRARIAAVIAGIGRLVRAVLRGGVHGVR
jgi:hypothetical protein